MQERTMETGKKLPKRQVNENVKRRRSAAQEQPERSSLVCEYCNIQHHPA
jgi:hypothetical protein